MMACVPGFVKVMWQSTWVVVIESVSKENGTGSGSPGCRSRTSKSTELLRTLGGVPVFSRPIGKPSLARASDRPTAAPRSVLETDMQETAQERAGRDHRAAGLERPAGGQDDTAQNAVLDTEVD